MHAPAAITANTNYRQPPTPLHVPQGCQVGGT